MIKEQRQINDIKSNNKVLSWTSPEFTYHPKAKSWYTAIAAIAIILLGFFYWQRMYAAMAVVAASVLALFMQARLKPQDIKYILSFEGLEFKGKTYSFDELKSFWIAGGSTSSKLYLNKTGKFTNPLVIELTKINPESVGNFLRQYLPEETKQSEHMNERISKLMKF